MKTQAVITHYLILTAIVKIEVMSEEELRQLKILLQNQGKHTLDWIDAIIKDTEDENV